jgi:hypothetical protein
MINPSRSDFLIEVNGKRGFIPPDRGDLFGIQMVPRQIKAVELKCIVTEQGGNLVSALVSTQQYSRKKYMPLRHVQLRI